MEREGRDFGNGKTFLVYYHYPNRTMGNGRRKELIDIRNGGTRRTHNFYIREIYRRTSILAASTQLKPSVKEDLIIISAVIETYNF